MKRWRAGEWSECGGDADGGRGRSCQAGVALVTALLIVALATTVSVALFSAQRVDIRRVDNQMGFDRSRLFALAGESWAMGILRKDREQGGRDDRTEDWAQVLPPMPVQGGMVSGRLVDLQGRFNLNNLVKDKQPDALVLARFQCLLQSLGLDPTLAHGVVDWIDADTVPAGGGGAENDFYLGKNPPYRSAGMPMTSVSELRLVAGFEPAVYARLAPFVAALPPGTPLNVNTASAEVLGCLAEGLSLVEGETLYKDATEEGFASVQVFLEHPALAGREVSGEGLTVGSQWFRAEIRAEVGRGRVLMFTDFRRPDQRVEVISRGFGAI
ncbi:MAG: type II secretion system minor pseudopilin GspK [Magnetococcus sp. WYHC-3]